MLVLVVDDFEPFRRFVSSTLQSGMDLPIIFEASDGLEAVEKARELQPDLILLDLGLPYLTGIEAARRIRELSPNSRILFISQETSSDLVQEAFRCGASGYVVKNNAGGELLTAVDTVVRGELFVGSTLTGYNSTETVPVKEGI